MVNTGSFTLNGATVNVAAGMTQAQLLNAINTSNAGGLPAGMKPAVINPSGHLVLESADADTQIAISGSSPALLAELGIGVGNTDPTNLLTQSAAAQGQTMVIQVGANPALTVTFGTGASEVSTSS